MADGRTYQPGRAAGGRRDPRPDRRAGWPGARVVADDGGTGRAAPGRRATSACDDGDGGAAADARRFGIISPMTEHFCATCNRLRLSTSGALHACLAYDDAVDLRGPLRAGGP